MADLRDSLLRAMQARMDAGYGMSIVAAGMPWDCCLGATDRGPAACTCWQPVYDLDQVDPDLDTIVALALGQQQPDVRHRMCDDCAYRPDSPERSAAGTVEGSPEQMEALAATGTRFWCHDGMRQPTAWRHPRGISSTLRMAAAQMRGRILYVAYNKAAATEAAASFPRNVRCSTVHALAFGATGRDYARRLRMPRKPARQAAEALGVRQHVTLGKHLALTPVHITRYALATVQRFCQSADREIGEQHLPPLPGIPSASDLGRMHTQIPALRAAGEHQTAAAVLADWEDGLRTRRDLAAAVLPVARSAWADLCDPNGSATRFEHDHYLKMWQLTGPTLSYDVVMLDEAQDSNPVTVDIVTRQSGQRIAIGDGCQQLYAWRGAIDALKDWPTEHRLYLTQSWRFGPAIADEANKWLTILGTDMRVRGNPHLPTVIERLTEPDAVLCRSNAGAVSRVMAALDAHRRPALVGGAGELVRLAQAAEELKTTGRTNHPELFLFQSWGAVQEYSEDAAGADLAVFVRLVDQYGAAEIIDALSYVVDEHQADVIVSTAHKSKGREWPRVAVADDFAEPKKSDDGSKGEVPRAEAMLAYVAVTRAKLALDPTGLAWVDQYTPEAAARGVA